MFQVQIILIILLTQIDNIQAWTSCAPDADRARLGVYNSETRPIYQVA